MADITSFLQVIYLFSQKRFCGIENFAYLRTAKLLVKDGH